MTQRAFRVVEGGRSPEPPPPWPARIWSNLILIVQARRGRRQLAEMEPRMLADIGASRADARAEAAWPWWDIASTPPDATRRRAR